MLSNDLSAAQEREEAQQFYARYYFSEVTGRQTQVLHNERIGQLITQGSLIGNKDYAIPPSKQREKSPPQQKGVN
jgi:hypothetical protein